MKVIKATKQFRQVALIGSLLFALISMGLLLVDFSDCASSNLKATTAVVFGLWSVIFTLFLIQATGIGSCLRNYPKSLTGFYIFVCAVMLFVQMEVFGGHGSSCWIEAPAYYWWLIVNIGVFYLIVTFGLATWGAYLCFVADAQDEMTKQAVSEYLAVRQKADKMQMDFVGDEDDEEDQPLLRQRSAF